MRTYLSTIARAHNRLALRLDQTIIETGLSASELLVMQVAMEEPDVSTAAILEATGLRASTLSSLLRRLEQRRYIRRQHGGRDGRSRLVTLTLPGERAARLATSIQLELERRLGGPKRRLRDLETLDAVAHEIAQLAPPPLDPEDGLPIATA